MSTVSFGIGNPADFVQHRAGRAPFVINPATLEQVQTLLGSVGIVQGTEYYTATLAETTAWNDLRASTAKSSGKEAPAAINLTAMAIRKARKAAGTILPYVTQAIDTTMPDKSRSEERR